MDITAFLSRIKRHMVTRYLLSVAVISCDRSIRSQITYHAMGRIPRYALEMGKRTSQSIIFME